MGPSQRGRRVAQHRLSCLMVVAVFLAFVAVLGIGAAVDREEKKDFDHLTQTQQVPPIVNNNRVIVIPADAFDGLDAEDFEGIEE